MVSFSSNTPRISNQSGVEQDGDVRALALDPQGGSVEADAAGSISHKGGVSAWAVSGPCDPAVYAAVFGKAPKNAPRDPSLEPSRAQPVERQSEVKQKTVDKVNQVGVVFIDEFGADSYIDHELGVSISRNSIKDDRVDYALKFCGEEYYIRNFGDYSVSIQGQSLIIAKI